MKLFRKIGIFLLIILSVVVFAACSGVSFTFPEYTLPYTPSKGPVAPDEDLKLDGVLDEAVWEQVAGNETTVVSDVSEDIILRTRTYLTQNGVYFGVTVFDNAVYYNPERSAARNTSAEIYLAARGSADYYCIRIVPDGEGTGLAGGDITWKLDPTNGSWYKWVIDWQGAAQVQGMMNTSTCQGYSAEVFVPWSSLGVDPAEHICYMPAFNHVESSSAVESERTWTGYRGCKTTVPTTYLGVTNEKVGSVAEIMDSTVVCDDYMTIDGNLNENQWQGLKPFSYQYNLGDGKTASVSTQYYGSELGAYLGITVKDKYIFASDTTIRSIGMNSGLELYVAKEGKEGLDFSTLQLRITADNSIDRYVGLASADYPWVKGYFPVLSATTIQGELNATDVSKNEGYTLEIFIPWEALGVAEKPEGILVYPVLVHSEHATNSVKTAPLYKFCSISGFGVNRNHVPSEHYILMRDEGPAFRCMNVEPIFFGDSGLRGDYYYHTFTVSSTAVVPSVNTTVEQTTVVPELVLPEGITYGVSEDNVISLRIPKALAEQLKTGETFWMLYEGAQIESTIRHTPVEIDGILDSKYSPYSFVGQHPDKTDRAKNTAYFYLGENALYIYQLVTDTTVRNQNTRTEWFLTFNSRVTTANTFSIRFYYQEDAHANCINGIRAYRYNANGTDFPLTEDQAIATELTLLVTEGRNGTYVMEAAIPYTALGLTEQPTSLHVAAITFNGNNKTNGIFANRHIPDISKFEKVNP